MLQKTAPPPHLHLRMWDWLTSSTNSTKMAGQSAAAKLSFKILGWCMIVFGGLCGVLALIFTVVKNPRTAFKKTPRDVPPKCLQDSSLGSHEYVRANGIKFHYVCAGDKSKPLMLFLHGFPEFWFSWRYQMNEFSKDFRVVAIDMRGYGETERPPNKLDYTFSKLKQDIVELVPALGYSKCTLVSHDWGGVVAWRVLSRHPELIERFIVMNCPHPKVYAMKLAKDWKQLFMSWYIFMFQIPKLPELIISMNDFETMKGMFINGTKNPDNFPPEVLKAYLYTFAQPGALTAAINYYRCMFKTEKSKATDTTPPPKKIEVPCLVIWGDDDTALSHDMADMHEAVVANLTVKHIPNCSHWVQQDAPETVNQYMSEFLADSIASR